MKTINWKEFWAEYRRIESIDEKDLFFQVGKTINKKIIPEVIFKEMIQDIIDKLVLSDTDVLLELCCGNGLLTLPLAQATQKVYAFDFTLHLIDAATRFKQAENIVYNIGDATTNFFECFKFDQYPNKYLMNDSLAYFTPLELDKIIERLLAYSQNFMFYITGIPSDALKWNFYDTEERRKFYYDNLNKSGANHGMGRWWHIEEIKDIADKYALDLLIFNQPAHISNYRINALLKTK